MFHLKSSLNVPIFQYPINHTSPIIFPIAYILFIIKLKVSAYLFPVLSLCKLARARVIHFTDSRSHAHEQPLRPVSLTMSMIGCGLTSYPRVGWLVVLGLAAL